jgi:hypothetical protein
MPATLQIVERQRLAVERHCAPGGKHLPYCGFDSDAMLTYRSVS